MTHFSSCAVGSSRCGGRTTCLRATVGLRAQNLLRPQSITRSGADLLRCAESPDLLGRRRQGRPTQRLAAPQTKLDLSSPRHRRWVRPRVSASLQELPVRPPRPPTQLQRRAICCLQSLRVRTPGSSSRREAVATRRCYASLRVSRAWPLSRRKPSGFHCCPSRLLRLQKAHTRMRRRDPSRPARLGVRHRHGRPGGARAWQAGRSRTRQSTRNRPLARPYARGRLLSTRNVDCLWASAFLSARQTTLSGKSFPALLSVSLKRPCVCRYAKFDAQERT